MGQCWQRVLLQGLLLLRVLIAAEDLTTRHPGMSIFTSDHFPRILSLQLCMKTSSYKLFKIMPKSFLREPLIWYHFSDACLVDEENNQAFSFEFLSIILNKQPLFLLLFLFVCFNLQGTQLSNKKIKLYGCVA